jgi:hypothetical protein
VRDKLIRIKRRSFCAQPQRRDERETLFEVVGAGGCAQRRRQTALSCWSLAK